MSEEAQAEIGEWGARNQAAQLLQELWKTISACSMAYKQGKLMGSCAVMRALPVLAISGFTPGGEVLRQDIAVILQSDVGDAPTLLRRYRAAVQSGDSEVIEAIGRRIGLDPMWDRWVSGFLTEAKALARPQEPSTHWEFPNSPMSKENSADICDWLFRRR